MPDFQYTYWDANVFISYLNNDNDRIPVLEAILEAVESSKIARIVTSVISKVEVAWVAQENKVAFLPTTKKNELMICGKTMIFSKWLNSTMKLRSRQES